MTKTKYVAALFRHGFEVPKWLEEQQPTRRQFTSKVSPQDNHYKIIAEFDEEGNN